MSKVLKIIAIAAIVAVAVFFIAPALAPGAQGFSLFGKSLAAAGTWQAAALAGATYGALAGISTLFIKKPSLSLGLATSNLNVSVDPQALGKWIFGRYPAATDILYAESHSSSGTNNKALVSYIIAGAAHRINNFGNLYVNDDLITFSGTDATGEYTQTLFRQLRIGSPGQTAFSAIPNAPWGWPSNAEGEDMSYYHLLWQMGKDKTQNGIPSRITQICEGAPVYDPRLDGTRGGSGSHRVDLQSTWQWTRPGDNVEIGRNWALVVGFWLIGWRVNGELIFGKGVDPDDIDYDQWMAAANICEEIVDGAERFFIDGILEMSNNHEEIHNYLEGAIGGSISQVGGKYFIWAPTDDLVAFDTIDEDDLLRNAGVEFSPSGPIEDLFNTGRGRFIDPAELYQPNNYPEVKEDTAVTQDGRVRVLEHDLACITETARAERIVRYLVRRSRFSATWRLAVGPKGLLYQPFTVLNLNIQETNFQDTFVRVVDMEFGVDGVVFLELVEEDASIYDTTAPLGTPVTQSDPSTFNVAEQPTITGLAVTPITLTGDVGTQSPGLQVDWDDPSTLVRSTELQYKRVVDSQWIDVTPTRVGFEQAIISGLDPDTQYQVRGRHITLFDRVGIYDTVTSTTNTNSIAYDTINVNGIPADQITSDIDAANLRGRSALGINVNDWNNGGVYRSPISTGQVMFQVRIDKALNRIYMLLGAGVGVTGGANIGFQFEVFGATMTGFVAGSLEGTELPVNGVPASVDFSFNTRILGVNGQSDLLWQVAESDLDECYWTVSDITDDTEFRIKINSAVLGTGGDDFSVVLGDATSIRSGLETSAPHEFFVTPTDSDKMDALLLVNGPIDAAATNNTIFRQDTQPLGSEGDEWYETDTGLHFHFTGGSWQLDANSFDNTNQLTDGASLGSTAIWTSVTGVGKPDDDATQNRVFNQPDQPAGTEGDIWVESDTGLQYHFTGGGWVLSANRFDGTSQLTDDANLGETAIWGSVTGTGKPADDATRNRHFRQATQPAGADGDTWYETDTGLSYDFLGSWQLTANDYSLTSELTDDAGLGNTANWPDITGTGKPDDNATQNTGAIRSDTFNLSAGFDVVKEPVDLWQQIRDGSTPVTLISGQSFRFDEAGTYLVTIQFRFTCELETTSSVFPLSETIQTYTRYAANGVTYAPADNYQYYAFIRPHDSTVAVNTTFGSTSHVLIIDAALNSRLQIYFNRVGAPLDFDCLADSKVDIVQLKQIPD